MKKLLLLLSLLGTQALGATSPCYFAGDFVQCFPTGGIYLEKGRTLRLGSVNGLGTNYVEQKASASLTASYSLTWPLDDGANGQILSTDGSGILSWATPSTPTTDGVIPYPNFVGNPGFELGTASWTNSGSGTFTTTTSATDVGFGTTAAVWHPAANLDALTSAQVTVPNGLTGTTSCHASIYWKRASGGAGAVRFQVIDGALAVLAGPLTLTAVSDYNYKDVNFTCPSSGSFAVQIFATGATTNSVFLDNAILQQTDNTASTPGNILYATNVGSGFVGQLTPLAPGTSVQVLHSGTIPSWSAVALAADVSGQLPTANGGTGQNSSATFPTSGVVVTEAATETLTNKTINGASNTLTVRLASDVSGILPTANGGTGQNSTATFPTSGVVVTEAGSETLSRKGILADGANGSSFISATGTLRLLGIDLSSATDNTSMTLLSPQTANRILTLPNATDTLVGKATTDTLTNKSISGSTNTITNVSLTTGVTGTLPIANGGTNAITKAAAFDSLSPMTTAGDVIYGGAAGTGTRLAAGTSVQVLHSGTTPSFAAVSLTADVSGTLPVANGGTGVTSSTGTGSNVLSNTPTLVTPVLGAATATSINFGGTSLSAYAEGIFTPVGATATPGTGPSNTNQTGRYTRIGNRVFIQMFLTFTKGVTSAGAFTISGLPFTSANVTRAFNTLSLETDSGFNNPATTSGIQAYVAPNTSSIALLWPSTIGAAAVSVAAGDLNAGGATMIITGSYEI